MTVQRYKVGYYSDEWGMQSSTPCLIQDDNGYAVKFEDYEKLLKQCAELFAALLELVASCDTGERRPDGKQRGTKMPDRCFVQAGHDAIARVKGDAA